MLQKVERETITVPANGSVKNVLSGTDLETAPSNGAFATLISGESAGVEVSVSTPSQPSVISNGQVGGSANNPPDPLRGDVLHGAVPVRSGERIKHDLNNTTAADIDVYLTVQFRGQ